MPACAFIQRDGPYCGVTTLVCSVGHQCSCRSRYLLARRNTGHSDKFPAPPPIDHEQMRGIHDDDVNRHALSVSASQVSGPRSHGRIACQSADRRKSRRRQRPAQPEWSAARCPDMCHGIFIHVESGDISSSHRDVSDLLIRQTSSPVAA